MLIIDLIYNLALLLAASVLAGFIHSRMKRLTIAGKVAQGLLFGSIVILGMNNPFVLAEGLIFDGRSVVLSLCAFFFGPVAAAIAVVMSLAYRIHLGGPGVIMGISVIISSAIIGLAFSWIKKFQNTHPIPLYLGLGLVVHVFMLMFILALPDQFRAETFNSLAFTIITIYPIATLLMAMVLHDNEEKSLLHSRLRSSEEKFRNLVDNAFDAIYIMEDRHYTYVNKGFADITGYTEEELLGPGFDFSMLLTPESKEVADKRYKARKKGELVKPRYQLQVLRKSGEIRDIEVSTVSMPMHNCVMVLGILRDITEYNETLKQLMQKNDELQQYNLEKDKLFSVVSHDLRGPFSAFLGFSEMMAEQIDELSKEEVREMAIQMQRAAISYYNLLENLLEWSKLRRGLADVNLHNVVIRNLIQKQIDAVKELAVKKDIKIILNVDPRILVVADENMLGSVFRNLLTNALKFSPRNSKIKISSACDMETGNIEVLVSDQGIGMSSSKLNNLFNIEQNNNTEGTAGKASTGLGLILCKELIEKQEGNIRAESQEDIGSTFFVCLKSNCRDFT